MAQLMVNIGLRSWASSLLKLGVFGALTLLVFMKVFPSKWVVYCEVDA